MKELQEKVTKLAVEVAHKMGYDLDFSHQSVQQVEEILGKIHDQYYQDMNDAGLNGLALEFAAYIVSVIQKNLNLGRWERDHEKMGKDSFPLFLDSQVIFPYGWCLKRIYDGAGDNVWIKYKTLILDKYTKTGEPVVDVEK
jgi:hypothetical protein